MKEGQQDSLTTREKEIQVQTQMDIISGYYRKIALTPEITIEYILQTLEADLQYIRESNAVLSVEKMINSAPLPSSGETKQNKPYNSPYPSEITYKSDKNFLVRLKAALDRNMRDLGYNINSDEHKELIERMNDAEDWFFESKIKSLPVTGDSEAIGERKFTLKEMKDCFMDSRQRDNNLDDESDYKYYSYRQYFEDKFDIEV